MFIIVRRGRRFAHLLDLLHAGHDVEHLPLTVELELDGLLDNLVVDGLEDGLDGAALGGGGGDEGRVAHAAYRHVHGARDGRGGHGEHVHLVLHRHDGLLLLHAEPLLLVDHQQGHVRVLHVLQQ